MSDDATPYEQLAALAERELELVCAFAPDAAVQLVVLGHERAALIERLPSAAPAEAQPALARASYLQQRTTATLATLCAGVARSLGEVDRGHRTARGYRGAPAQHQSVDHTG